MTKPEHLDLIAAVLASQSEPEGAEAMTDDRIREALTGGPRFTNEEKRLLWTSPDTRDQFLAIRRQVRLDLSEAVARAGLGTSEMRLAASGSSSEEEIIGNGFVVMLFRDEEFAEQYSVSVELAEDYLKLLPAETPVALEDTGGLVWARGVPDAYRRIGAIWTHDEAPKARLSRYKLRLNP